MARDNEIIPILRRLALAFPGQKLEMETLGIYVARLRDIPGWLLNQTIDQLIESAAFFPKIAEIRETAAKIANTKDFELLPPYLIDKLIEEAQALEDAFYYEKRLEPKEWEDLARRFEEIDRPFRAAYAREKLRRLTLINGRG